ncbi:MAG: hypothetical protein NZM28_05040, partial [Fimbriimonadales bacterium]|nr:hypothetical protein [Fimbriimonadales bacterium]
VPITIATLEELEAVLEQHPEWQERLAEKIFNERTIRRALQSNPELKETLRREILGEELLKLPALVQELVEVVKGLTTRVESLEQRVGGLEQRMENVERELAEVRSEVAEVRSEVAEVRSEVSGLSDWRQGETARREGEQYQRRVVARAARTLGVGTGGSPEYDRAVRDQVVQWLAQADLLDGDDDEDFDDPLAADLIWWKPNGKVAVAEISIKVNGQDVQRAQKRAQALRAAGLDVTAVVIGSEWAHPETQTLAEQAGVEWRVGKKLSEGLKAFRKAS